MKLSRLLTLTLFFSLFLLSLTRISDYDIWYHLKTGEWILQHFRIPFHDPFSFTASREAWVAHEWLSQLLFHLVFALFSFPGVLLFKALLILLTFALVFQKALLRGASLSYAVLFVFVAALCSAGSFTERPHLFSFLLTAFTLFRLEKKPLSPLHLFFLGLFWANLHSSFLLLFVLLGAHGIFREHKLPFRSLGAAFLGALVNPHGLALFLYPFTVAWNPQQTANIQEWFSPNFHLPQLWLLEGALFLPLLFWAKRVKPSPFFLFLFLFFGHLSLQAVRHIPLFAVAVAPYFAEGMTKCFPYPFSERHSPLHFLFLFLYAALLVALLPKGKGEKNYIDTKEFPVSAVAFLKTHPFPPNLLTSYEWGGYALFHLYPDYRVFIDGRADLYAKKVLPDYLHLLHADSGFERILFKYRVQTVLFPKESLLVRELKRLGWREVYRDRQVAILTASAPLPASFAKRLTESSALLGFSKFGRMSVKGRESP